MRPFTHLTSVAVPLLRDNIDTDTIIPSREIRTTGRTGLASGLFAPWRYSSVEDRKPAPDFALNQPRYAGASILLAGRNFGCGSSREHAVWALAEYGIRAVIAVSFAPIFAANCIRNGILPVVLPREAIERLAAADRPIEIALPGQQVQIDAEQRWFFEIVPEAKRTLLEGLDTIDVTLELLPRIDAFHRADRLARPWIYLGDRRQ